MLSLIHRHLLLPAFESGLKRRKTLRYWSRLEKSQWLAPAQIETMQFQALQRLISHAQEHSPYYRETWRELGVGPNTLSAPADFRDWPLIDRDVIRANRTRMRADVPEMKLIQKATGGSNGSPLSFDLDWGSNDRRTAAWHRGYGWAGAAPGTKQLYLWGVPLGARPRFKQWKDALYNRFNRRLVLNTFDLSDDRVPEFLAKHNAYRPEVIVAYTNPLYVFARALHERGLVPYAPRSIVVGAEKLHPFQRDLIEEVFRAPVFETYGSREFMLIGAECDRHEGLHLTSEQLLVEILDDEGRPTPPGEEGNVVITDLFNYGMPFIRYVNGDRAIAGWGTCSCGRGLPLLKSVVGRQLDVLQTADGRRIPGEFFPHLLKDFPAVRRFQVVQDDPHRIELKMVATGDWSEADAETLEREVRNVIGAATRFDVVRVDDIPLTTAGKLRVVVNRCPAATGTEFAALAAGASRSGGGGLSSFESR